MKNYLTAKKILILSGGFSAEREVSLRSGQEVAKALKKCGYHVVCHDLTSTKRLLKILHEEKPEVVFNSLHGNWGEDGTIQGFLDLLQIPYTHSDMEASFLGMNKQLAKQICQQHHIPTAPYEVMTYGDFKKNGVTLNYPYVVKPRSEGSSVDVYIVHNKEEKDKVLFATDKQLVLIEAYIPGQELTVAVIKGKACGVTELKPKNLFYDYQAKYTCGLTEHVLPAFIPDEVAEVAMRTAEKIHNLLGCRTLSRVDFRYNASNGLVFLEINTHPGLTSLSLVPEQAKYMGISFEELCQMLVDDAQCRRIIVKEKI